MRFLLALAVLLSMTGCSMLSGVFLPAPTAHVASTPLNAAERDFVTKVANRTVYEIEVSKLAAERASSPAVRDYAEAIIAQHSRMNDELARLMSAHGVAPPKGLAADKATKLH